MAYGNYYPQYFQPNPQQNQSLQQMQPINSGLVPVPSESVARNYPVGFGQSVSFRDENLPFLYTKTMGFSQLEPPKFEKYRLVKEETQTAQIELSEDKPIKYTAYVEKSEFDAVLSDIEAIKKDIADLKEGV